MGSTMVKMPIENNFATIVVSGIKRGDFKK
jgi:hypothetical protein